MAEGFFTTAKRGARWFLIDPSGKPFFSIGMNHVDSASLRYAENIHIWRERYGNSQLRWLREAVGPDLRDWEFNTVGWCQEVIIRGETIHRHSRNFSLEEYQWLGLPYCHMLPFTEAHQWELETRIPDV
ncbi:MAG: agarase, partial [Candidatus Latescibacteria bacterium]|nr:agarase [Candidatus Latescibacterota bacterium]